MSGDTNHILMTGDTYHTVMAGETNYIVMKVVTHNNEKCFQQKL